MKHSMDTIQCRLHLCYLCPLPLVHSRSCDVRLDKLRWNYEVAHPVYRNKRTTLYSSVGAGAGGQRTTNRPQRLLAIGGSGRVGQETLQALSKLYHGPVSVSVAARDSDRARRATDKLTLSTQSFGAEHNMTFSPVQLDIDSIGSDDLITLLSEFDVVVHTAGPFQGRRDGGATLVAETAIKAGTFYVDICDDSDCAFDIASLSGRAEKAGVIGITSAGIYPGISNLLVCDAILSLRDEFAADNDSDSDISSIRLYYFTAGSGGIGATVLASTFLLLGEDADVYEAGGQLRMVKATAEPTVVDFGGLIGKRTTFILRLPEVRSLHQFVAPKASISAKFATAPSIWNGLLPLMTNTVPKQWLSNRTAMKTLADISLPFVKAVDVISGARTGILAEAVNSNGRGARVAFEHETLSQCVGEGTAAFVKQLLIHKARTETETETLCSMKPGIWFPEQLSSELQRDIIKDGTSSCERLERSFF